MEQLDTPIPPASDITLQPHVLVVDDEAAILHMISLCLKQANFRVMTACTAAEAGDLIVSHEFDVIITDVMLPGEDGLKFLASVHERFADLPVIVMTGYAHLQMAVNAVRNGAFDFIHKPFDFTYLREVVSKAANYRRLLRMEQNYRSELEQTVAMRTADLKNALLQLEKTRTELLAAAQEKSEFITTITHEMRTPMNGVIGALDLLGDEELSGSQREYLAMARQSANSMMELVDRVLSFARGSRQAAIHSHQEVVLPDFLAQVSDQYRHQAQTKGLELIVTCDSAVPQRIRCDGEQLARLLEILLGNALKFTDKGRVCLSVNPCHADGVQDGISFTVSDSGIGVPDDMLERIFDPFVQADGSLTRRFGGVGLGLSIGRQIAELLNGRLWAEHADEGSRFHFQMKADVIAQGDLM